MFMRLCSWSLPVLVLCVGCASAKRSQKSASPSSETGNLTAEQAFNQDAGQPAAKAGPEGGKAAPVDRKIIRTADLTLVVDDFDQAEKGIHQLVGECKDCYVAQADLSGSTGSPRRGRWKIRVPVDHFENFLEMAGKLGVLQTKKEDSQDVTEEYYDLAARTKNKKVEEERLLKHLEKSTGKLEDILAVERELSRVRGEIEQQEGRLRLLGNLTALTTVTISIQEIKNYVPPQSPTFGTDVRKTFSDSFDALIAFGRGLALVAVAIIPWLPVIAIILLPGWLIIRRRIRKLPG
jgi:hypothetical protein